MFRRAAFLSPTDKFIIDPVDPSKVPRRSPWDRGQRSVVWTKDEDAAIIQRHKLRDETADSLCARLGKSKSAIYRRAIQLGCERDGKRWRRGPRAEARYFIKENFHPNANPIVVSLYDIANQQQVSFGELERRSGVGRITISAWGHRTAIRREPNLYNFEAVLNSLGYKLVLVRRTD